MRFLLCFSITRNTSKIMDCSVPPGAITSVNGVRVLSLWWVILGHTYGAIAQGGILSKFNALFVTRFNSHCYHTFHFFNFMETEKSVFTCTTPHFKRGGLERVSHSESYFSGILETAIIIKIGTH